MDETSVYENQDSIELKLGSAGEATYDNLNRRSVTSTELYECLKPERKIVESSKMDKKVDRKFVLILPSIVVIALVVTFIVVAVIIYAVVRGNATDGAWTLWGEWGFCSVTCGGGLRIRNRTCTNPPPNLTGRYCDGNLEQMKICNNVPCEEKVSNDSVVAKGILFSARGLKNLSPSHGETLVFETIITNKGSAYDKTTGIFTVPVGGMFMFSVQLCLRNKNKIYYEITTDSRVLLKGLSIDDYDSPYGCYATSVPAFLTAGERVWVKSSTSFTYLWEDASINWNMFSGVLV